MQRVRLVELRLDDELWQRGSAARRLEWQGAIRDFIETATIDVDLGRASYGDGDATTEAASRLRHATNGLLLELHRPGDSATPLCAAAIPQQRVSPMVDEYAQICAELVRPGHAPPRLEALDIAKRLVHDEAGEVLQGLLSPVRIDHQTARRLFTLIVTVLVDTTQLAIRPHLKKA